MMMIQPFLENAIWHGILPMGANGHIMLEIDRESNSLLKIKVEDNGVGINETFISDNFLEGFHEGHGPCIAMQRLKLLEKISGQPLFMKYKHKHPEKENKGTIAEYLLPV